MWDGEGDEGCRLEVGGWRLAGIGYKPDVVVDPAAKSINSHCLSHKSASWHAKCHFL